MIALAFAADELPAQLNDLRQIHVIPFHPAAFGHALEARIKAAPDMDDDCVRAAVQKIARKAIELPQAQNDRDLIVLPKLDPREIIIELLDQRRGLLVLDECIRTLCFFCPKVERDQ
jgi:hypothetical protein